MYLMKHNERKCSACSEQWGGEVRASFFSHYLKHGSCWLKPVPRRVTLQHLHYCRSSAPISIQSEYGLQSTILQQKEGDNTSNATLFTVNTHSQVHGLGMRLSKPSVWHGCVWAWLYIERPWLAPGRTLSLPLHEWG